MYRQRGVVHLFLLLILLIVGVLVFFFVFKGNLKNIKIPFLAKKPTVKLQEKYTNPFAKESQFVNPFDTYKNPFVVNR